MRPYSKESMVEKVRVIKSYMDNIYHCDDFLVISNHYGKIKRAMWDEVRRLSNSN